MRPVSLADRQVIYDRFLEEWPESRVKSMPLSDYVDVENHSTFCYWVERETRPLGSILGSPAIKFGIYKRKGGKAPVAQYANDLEYSWRPFYGDNRDEAFNAIRNEILRVIDFSKRGQFAEIDSVRVSPMFKWKAAFLYSNERLVPIYEEKILRRIGQHFGLRTDREFLVSNIQELMMQNKPADLEIYEYMENLWYEFSDSVQPDRAGTDSRSLNAQVEQRTRRRPSLNLNTNTQVRSVSRSYVVEQKHKILQLLLREKLADEFGEENVQLEQDFVDLRLVQPKQITFYEVKTSSYALACIREAIGQLLYYSIRDEDARQKRLVVVGQYPPNPSEEAFIEKLRKQLNVDLTYEYLALS